MSLVATNSHDAAESAAGVLRAIGIRCFAHVHDGVRLWSLGWPEAVYRVSDARLIEHARVATAMNRSSGNRQA